MFFVAFLHVFACFWVFACICYPTFSMTRFLSRLFKKKLFATLTPTTTVIIIVIVFIVL